MRAAPGPLADFRRDCTKKFDYLTRQEIDEIVAVVRDLAERQDALSEEDIRSSSGSCGSSRCSAAGAGLEVMEA